MADTTRWDPTVYLAHAGMRERPFDELLARVPLAEAARVVDLGCGPGTATRRLADRWPGATVLGVDSSPEMIAAADEVDDAGGRLRFELGRVESWRPAEPVDVVMCNAVLQWVPGHPDLLGGLLEGVRPGGVFAFQVPANFDEPSHTILRDLVRSGRWSIPTDGLLRDRPVLEPGEYLTRLLALGADADVWETTYLQVLTGPDAVLGWTRGTALRPVLSALDAESTEAFLAAYGAALNEAYPPDAAGRTVLPFRRIFAVARRD